MKKKTPAKKKYAPKRAAPALTVSVFMSPVNLKWYFHAKAQNGEIVAQSEGYANKADAEGAVNVLKKGMRTADVVIIQ